MTAEFTLSHPNETMFSDRDKLIALAIVHIFETAKPFGDYSAVAILNDGAGISYGINQFTHRSGSLYRVIEAYFDQKPSANVEIIARAMPMLRLTTEAAIYACSKNEALKSALRLAGQTTEMRTAQNKVATELYLQPAIDACDGSNFTEAMSLAVIYDSINHGSYEKIRDRVTVDRSEHPNAQDFERTWIADYVTERDQWLASVPRLASTRYRTRFFLNQIKLGNWALNLPVRPNGVTLSDAMFSSSAAAPVVQPTNSDTFVAPENQTISPSESAQIGPPPNIFTKAFTWLFGK